MVALGKAVRNAVRSGRHESTKPMRKTQSISPDTEGCEVNEVQIPVTKIEPQRPFLDTLAQSQLEQTEVTAVTTVDNADPAVLFTERSQINDPDIG
jgi:hypothetical protein